MTRGLSTATAIASALPEELPVLPLYGSVLLPQARLPLNIFEPRYLSLVEDALGNGRMIGLIQPKKTEEIKNPPLYSVGCAGRIISFNETEDGRFLIVLLGVCRFRVVTEKKTENLYRAITPDWTSYLSDFSAKEPCPIPRKRLMELMRLYFKKNAISVDWTVIKGAPDEILLPTIIMICPFAPNEKQALLEAKDTAACIQMLVALLEMAVMPQTENAVELRH